MRAHAVLVVLMASAISLVAPVSNATAAQLAASTDCAPALGMADRAMRFASAQLAGAVAGGVASERSVAAVRSDRAFARASAACRAWALANGAAAEAPTARSFCFRAVQGAFAYLQTIAEELELLRAYAGRPPPGNVDFLTMRALGQRGTTQLRAWLWSSDACRSAIGAGTNAVAATSLELTSGGTTTIAARGSRQYAAVARDANSATLRIPILWSVEPATVGTIDNTGWFEAGALGECGRIIASAGDISAWIDVCVVEVATASY